MTTNLNIRTEKEIKDGAEAIFSELGISMTTAVNMFLRQAIRTGGIPFELKVDVPNKLTAQAIAEGRKIAKDDAVKGCVSMDELKAALEEE